MSYDTDGRQTQTTSHDVLRPPLVPPQLPVMLMLTSLVASYYCSPASRTAPAAAATQPHHSLASVVQHLSAPYLTSAAAAAAVGRFHFHAVRRSCVITQNAKRHNIVYGNTRTRMIVKFDLSAC